jgi:hypothetical protein
MIAQGELRQAIFAHLSNLCNTTLPPACRTRWDASFPLRL